MTLSLSPFVCLVSLESVLNIECHFMSQTDSMRINGCFKGGSRDFKLCFKEDRGMFDGVLSVF